MLVLGSASPVRAMMLENAGIAFTQIPSSFDEEGLPSMHPKSFVYRATLGKLEAAVQDLGSDRSILCADTVVTSQNRLLRKAKNRDDARQILLTQSGSETRILTCSALHTPTYRFIDLSATIYHFAPFDSDHLETYLESGEWENKAGACMVEGFCKPYIKEVHGYESTAMGLCVEKLLPYLSNGTI